MSGTEGPRVDHDEPRDLLVRAPVLTGGVPSDIGPIDRVAQLGELADLLGRGLMSRADFERQTRKVLGGPLSG